MHKTHSNLRRDFVDTKIQYHVRVDSELQSSHDNLQTKTNHLQKSMERIT